MGKIVISENVTVDGVIQDPTGEQGFKYGGWFNRLGGSDREAWATVEYEEALAAEALLMGRHSYEYFAPRWASRDGAWAERPSHPSHKKSRATIRSPSATEGSNGRSSIQTALH